MRLIGLHERMLEQARAGGDRRREAAELVFLGQEHLVPAEEAKAADCFKKAIDIVHASADRRTEAVALLGLGKAYEALGRKELALSALAQALPIQLQLSDPVGYAETSLHLGEVNDSLGMKQKAAAYYRVAWNMLLLPGSQAQEVQGSTGSTTQSVHSPAQQALKARQRERIARLQEQLKRDMPELAASAPAAAASSEQEQSASASTASMAQADSAASADEQATSSALPADAGPPPPAATQEAQQAGSNQDQQQNGRPTHITGNGADSARNDADLPVSSNQAGSSPGGRAIPTVERYPNIEAPDSVAPGHEIAVQVSLTAEQIAPETKILSGQQSGGKLQLQMAEGERQWTLTVNLSAPGMEITRGGSNTAEITIDRNGDSTIAAFYLRAQPLDSSANGKRDTRILATLWHNGAFLARIGRPLTILDPNAQGVAGSQTSSLGASADRASAATPRPMASTRNHVLPVSVAKAPVSLDPSLEGPDITIVENRIGNTLRIDFHSSDRSIGSVYADISDPIDLHNWINSHFAQMSTLGRGFGNHSSSGQPGSSALHATDALNAFGADLYDKYAPPAFKTLLFKVLAKNPQGKQITIQVLSDDPSLPWELMRPALPGTTRRMDFLGVTCSIARWPLSRSGSSRPPQAMSIDHSIVVAPAYKGAQSLAAANLELKTLKGLRGFSQIGGDYVSVRQLALHPPQGIVHFAGHGAVNQANGVPQFAILLENGEQMDPTTWQGLGSSDAANHPLFFFNACDVGESVQFMNDVDGWAPALLGNGASGYIGALWPVQDTTAALFAAAFYSTLDRSLAAGQSLNVASLLAMTRAEIFRQTGDATALAYVFYGDPLLILTSPQVQP
jgi:tetratricopeptide (TPR) repeat protein